MYNEISRVLAALITAGEVKRGDLDDAAKEVYQALLLCSVEGRHDTKAAREKYDVSDWRSRLRPLTFGLTPAVDREESVTEDAIISLEDGRTYRQLAVVARRAGMEIDEYLEKWGLPHDYPRSPKNLAQRRSFGGRKARGHTDAAEEIKNARFLLHEIFEGVDEQDVFDDMDAAVHMVIATLALPGTRREKEVAEAIENGIQALKSAPDSEPDPIDESEEGWAKILRRVANERRSTDKTMEKNEMKTT